MCGPLKFFWIQIIDYGHFFGYITTQIRLVFHIFNMMVILKSKKIIKFNSFEMVRSAYPRYILLNVWRKCEGLLGPQNSDKICTWPWTHWLVSWLVSNFQIKIIENSHQFGFQTFVAGQSLSIQYLFDIVWLSLWILCRCRHGNSVREKNSIL